MNITKVIVRTLAKLARPVVVEAIAQQEGGGAGRPGTTGLFTEAINTAHQDWRGLEGVSVAADGAIVFEARFFTIEHVRLMGANRYRLVPKLNPQ